VNVEERVGDVGRDPGSRASLEAYPGAAWPRDAGKESIAGDGGAEEGGEKSSRKESGDWLGSAPSSGPFSISSSSPSTSKSMKLPCEALDEARFEAREVGSAFRFEPSRPSRYSRANEVDAHDVCAGVGRGLEEPRFGVLIPSEADS
jgi:hypothetical protein